MTQVQPLYFLQKNNVRIEQPQTLTQLVHHHLAIELREAFVDVVRRNVQGGLCGFMRQFFNLGVFPSRRIRRYGVVLTVHCASFGSGLLILHTKASASGCARCATIDRTTQISVLLLERKAVMQESLNNLLEASVPFFYRAGNYLAQSVLDDPALLAMAFC